MTSYFKLKSPFPPAGDQIEAIEKILTSLQRGDKHHVLLGVTGSGKTFTMANVIARLQKPALVIAPNKTLAAQLYLELKGFFPEDAVGYFISYYDYYQPEAYIPNTDTYIAKDSAINEDIDKMRHEATRNLFEKPNSIVVASVSCIYGLGSPETYADQMISIKRNSELSRSDLLHSLVDIQYQRNDTQILRGHFRVRGDIVDIMPSHQKEEAVRVGFFGDEVETIQLIDALTGSTLRELDEISIYPNSHYVTQRKDLANIIVEIQNDLGVRLREFKAANKLVEFQRLEQRTMQDIETLEQLGYCPGIENYSRYLSGARPGEPPPCLLDYFPKDFLTIVDESHITLPQIRGMYRGDRARKQNLVDFGFRLPAALDNRPLTFEEFLQRTPQILHVSATPGTFELETTKGVVTEQVIRPTGLLDPPISVRPARDQVDDLIGTIKGAVKEGGRVLITTLTKKMAEDLTTHYLDLGIKVRYMHSDIETLERTELLRDLRRGVFDVMIGINLLREGLDLPEVSLVAVMDADKEGFLRSRSSLIQIVGRAARNEKAQVIFYADTITDSMRQAMEETERRRNKQLAYNREHGIEPKTVAKALQEDLRSIYGLNSKTVAKKKAAEAISDPMERLQKLGIKTPAALNQAISKKSQQMLKLAAKMEFERAAILRDEINELKGLLLAFDEL